MISDLEASRRTDHEYYTHDYKLEETNLSVECDPSEASFFAVDYSTSSFIKGIIETSSSKKSTKLNNFLISATKK